jgi:hypothetical protein
MPSTAAGGEQIWVKSRGDFGCEFVVNPKRGRTLESLEAATPIIF